MLNLITTWVIIISLAHRPASRLVKLSSIDGLFCMPEVPDGIFFWHHVRFSIHSPHTCMSSLLIDKRSAVWSQVSPWSSLVDIQLSSKAGNDKVARSKKAT